MTRLATSPNRSAISSPAYNITHLKLIGNGTHAISTERVVVYIYQESERERHLGTPCHRQNAAMRIQSLHMLGGIWGKKSGRKVLTEDRSKTFPEWKRGQLQWRHLVVQHPNVRGRLSATELPKVVRKSTGLQCRKEAWKSESAHTHTHEGFQAFCLFFLITFQLFFLHLYDIERTRTFKE